MILLRIKNITKFNPIKWDADLTTLKEGQNYLQYFGDHPNNPEYGSVEISTKLTQGSLDDIDEVFFIGNTVESGKLEHWKRDFWGNYRVKVKLDSIFKHGLKYCVKNFIQPGGVIIGLSPEDKSSLKGISGQKDLLDLLSAYIIPSKRREILSFAKPSLLLVPFEENNAENLQEIGENKIDTPRVTNNEIIFPLAKLDLSDTPESVNLSKLQNTLSFHLKITNIDQDWEDRRYVFQMSNAEVGENIISNSGEYDIMGPTESLLYLDIPGYNHSLLFVKNFSDEEREQYEVLSAVFKQIIIGKWSEEEVSKLFGYPDSVQNCVSYEAERVNKQREYGDEIYENAVSWQLLLQILPSRKEKGFQKEVGSSIIYYMVEGGKLENGDFSNVQVITQGT